MSPKYPWRRFWFPTDEEIQLDGGYLIDPENEYGKYYNQRGKPLESFSQIKCLVLLGEPGIGKSTEISFEESVDHTGDLHVTKNLAVYQTISDLRQDIFDSTEVAEWKTGSRLLFLSLDSLDEALLSIEVLALRLPELLKTLAVDRLRLRIACRPAVWPQALEDSLRQLWKEKPTVLQLAPLRRGDVLATARERGLDANAFLSKVDELGVSPLAARPITLEMLLKMAEKGRLGRNCTQRQVYQEGCQWLAEETSKNRRAANRIGDLSGEQRFAVATRIAYIVTLSGMSSVWIASPVEDRPESAIQVAELVGGAEPLETGAVVVDEAGVRETLDTALFAAGSTNAIRLAHRSYGEFLAAKYAASHLTFDQIRDVLLHATPDGRIVPPQLYSVAAWLAVMRPDVLRYLIGAQPRVLVDGDALDFPEPARAQIVDRLLDLARRGDLHFHSIPYNRYSKLKHTGLAAQLEPTLLDKASPAGTREIAFGLAMACDVEALGDCAATICLDVKEKTEIRTRAAYAVRRIGNAAAKERLKALVQTGADDPNDEIKGCALDCCFPLCMNVEELLAALQPPKTNSFIGAYRGFLQDLATRLAPNELPTLLRWIVSETPPYTSPFRELAGALCLRALENLDTTAVPDALVAFLATDFGMYTTVDRDIREEFRAASGHKRLLPHLLSSLREPKDLVQHYYPLFDSSDVPWLIQELQIASSSAARQALAKLIAPYATTQSDAVIVACQWSAELASALSHLIDPIEIASDEARRQREFWEQGKRREEERQPLRSPTPRECVLARLEASERDSPFAWLRLVEDLSLKPRSIRPQHGWDVATMPGWIEADAALRERILSGAVRFLENADSVWRKFVGTNKIATSTLRAYQALRLLYVVDRPRLNALGTATWTNWAGDLLFVYLDREEEAIRGELLKLTLEKSRDAFLEPLLLTIRCPNAMISYNSARDRINACWSDDMAKGLKKALRSGHCRASAAGIVVADLLVHRVDGSEALARSLLRFPLRKGGCRRIRTTAIVRALLQQRPSLGWALVRPHLENDPDLLAGITADEIWQHSWKLDGLSEEQAGNYFELLVKAFPGGDDLGESEAAVVLGSRQDMDRYSYSVLEHIQNRGTWKAVEVLAGIRDRHPELPWLAQATLSARRVAAERQWTPPRPSELLALAEPKNRLVQDGETLLDLITECLKRYETQVLHGDTPRVARLWSDVQFKPEFKAKPKDEAELSDELKVYLERELRDAGIVINREVEVSRNSKTGFYPDIYVTATLAPQLGGDQIRAAVEVKGNWNDELMTAIPEQLVRKYFNASCCSGMAVIGWYNCPSWDSDDYRQKLCAKLDREAITLELKRQAKEASKDGRQVRVLILDTSR